MNERHYLAFDFGAESGRAIVGTLAGGLLSLDEKHRFANPSGVLRQRLEWNLLAQWQHIKQGLKNTKGITLSGIGVDTWGVDFGLIDANGEVLGNPMMYRDPSTYGIIDKCCEFVSREEMFETTGVQFLHFNSLFQLVALVQRNDSRLRVAHKILWMPDLFNYLLTGVARAEMTIASTGQMIDPRSMSWASSMLGELQVPVDLLPELIRPGTVLGDLLPEVANECGIPSAPVIAVAGHDTASAVVSVPAEDDTTWCYISSGTWSLMGVELSEPLINADCRRFGFTNEVGINGSIRLLKNIAGLWLVQECRRQFDQEGYDHSYSELVQMATRSQPFQYLIDPGEQAFHVAGNMPQKIIDFCEKTGQRAPLTRGATVRACFDTLACEYRQTLDQLELLTKKKVERIYIVGGGSQNALLNQITADVCQRAVYAGPVEATAIGNVLVQAIARGDIGSQREARGIVRNSFPVKSFMPSDAADAQTAYERYLSLQAKS